MGARAARRLPARRRLTWLRMLLGSVSITGGSATRPRTVRPPAAGRETNRPGVPQRRRPRQSRPHQGRPHKPAFPCRHWGSLQHLPTPFIVSPFRPPAFQRQWFAHQELGRAADDAVLRRQEFRLHIPPRRCTVPHRRCRFSAAPPPSRGSCPEQAGTHSIVAVLRHRRRRRQPLTAVNSPTRLYPAAAEAAAGYGPAPAGPTGPAPSSPARLYPAAAEAAAGYGPSPTGPTGPAPSVADAHSGGARSVLSSVVSIFPRGVQ